MLSKILDRYRALTRHQRAVLLVGAALPLIVVIALLVGVAADAAPMGASVSLGVLSLGLLGAVAYVIMHWRFMRRMTAEAAEVAAVTAVARRPANAIVEGNPNLLGESATARRLKWLYDLSASPNQVMRGHGSASRTVAARDYFALRTTHWRFDWESLRVLLADRSTAVETTLQLTGPIDGNYGITLARLVLSQRLEETDTLCATRLLQLSLINVPRLQVVNREIALQLLLHLEEEMPTDEALEYSLKLLANLNVGTYPARFLQLDVLNPWRSSQGRVSEDLWLAAANGIFTRSGLEPLRLLPAGATPFDRLDASPGTPVTDGPLVTVIMSCYNPGSALRTAVRSMLAQTWESWELIITDDASPDDPTALLDEIAALDRRIRVIRNETNAGTYVRRNEAILAANGEFITMQDSDDWVHPRRLEIQMRHLLSDKQILANLSQSVRLSERLMFAQPRGTTVRIAESSLLFRKDPVLARIGFFDSVRKAADSEFRLRLEASIGAEVEVVDVEAPLSLVRFDNASLSGSDLGDGWMHPARIAYRGAQAQWRQERSDAGMPLTLGFPLDDRPFPAHSHLTGGPRPAHKLDVLFVLDTTGRGRAEGVVTDVLRDVRALRRAGLHVGVRRAITIGELRALESTHASIQALINAGDLAEVLSVDHAESALTVVRHPDCLVGVGEGEEPVTSGRIVVVGGKERVPFIYATRGLQILGADLDTVEWMSRSTWASEVSRLCGAVPEGDTLMA